MVAYYTANFNATAGQVVEYSTDSIQLQPAGLHLARRGLRFVLQVLSLLRPVVASGTVSFSRYSRQMLHIALTVYGNSGGVVTPENTTFLATAAECCIFNRKFYRYCGLWSHLEL